MPRLPALGGADLIHALQKIGFEIVRQRGSHVRLIHSDGRVVAVPVHARKQLGRGLLRKISRDTELTGEELYVLLKK